MARKLHRLPPVGTLKCILSVVANPSVVLIKLNIILFFVYLMLYFVMSNDLRLKKYFKVRSMQNVCQFVSMEWKLVL